MFEDIIRHIQVCIPFRLLKDDYLSLVIENRINPEIGMDAAVLDSSSEKSLTQVASILRREDLSVTLHGPFFDLSPGAMDPLILSATRKRLKQLCRIAPLFEPKSIVCHGGYDRKRYCTVRDVWVDTAVETWQSFLKCLEPSGIMLVIENVYEKTPEVLVKLFERLADSHVGFCFDTGHMHAFSDTAMEEWLQALGPYLRQIHIHDNDGTWDHHWAVGAGDIHFERLFRYLNDRPVKPVVTLEPHQEEGLWKSLEALSQSPHFRKFIASHQSLS